MRGNRPLSSGGWSTAGRAGRKKTDIGTRPPRNMRATDEEWQLIKKFAEIAKSDLPQAERRLKMYDIFEVCPGYPDKIVLEGLSLEEAEEEAYQLATKSVDGVDYEVRTQ